MKNKIIISSLLLTVSILFVSCNSDDSDTVMDVSDDTAIVEISSSNLSGFIESEAFTPEATMWGTIVEDDVQSYVITFFDNPEECDEDMGLGDIFLKIKSETELATGYYDGQELHFYNKSSGMLFVTNALVNVDEVTSTAITGRVKGLGNGNGNSLEGKFIAQLCGN